jgi:hypothetical protein
VKLLIAIESEHIIPLEILHSQMRLVRQLEPHLQTEGIHPRPALLSLLQNLRSMKQSPLLINPLTLIMILSPGVGTLEMARLALVRVLLIATARLELTQ